MVKVSTSSDTMSSDIGKYTDIRDRYEYQRTMQPLKNSISKIYSSQSLIKELIELSCRQAGE